MDKRESRIAQYGTNYLCVTCVHTASVCLDKDPCDSGFLRSNTNIDAVVTPESYREMPGTLSRLVAGDIGFIVSNEISDDLYQEILPIEYLNIPNRALILGKGCNQKCAYCIEPICSMCISITAH